MAGTIEAIYGMIVTQTRIAAFYRDLGVPNTVDGRFDLLVVHLWLVLSRLRTGHSAGLAQGLFDRFCADMDDNLREMGVGDLTVPKRMRAFGEAFYGRSFAYDEAMAAGEAALVQAFRKNVFNGREGAGAELAAYACEVSTALSAISDADLAAGRWAFPVPRPLDALQATQ